MFTIEPKNGVLVPEIEFKAVIQFHCKQPVCFNKVPIFRCTFSYPEYSVVIESFIVTATAKVHLPKYEIFPSNEIHFGYQLISTEKYQEMLVKNTGMFHFNYVIKSLKDTSEQKNKKKSLDGKKLGSVKSASKLSSKSSGKGSKKSETKTKSSKISQESKLNKKNKHSSAKYFIYLIKHY